MNKAERRLSQAKRLRTALDSLHISQTELAEKLGITPQYVSNILSDRSGLPYRHAKAIEREYGVSVEWLLDGEGPMMASQSEPMPTHGLVLVPILRSLPETIDDISSAPRQEMTGLGWHLAVPSRSGMIRYIYVLPPDEDQIPFFYPGDWLLVEMKMVDYFEELDSLTLVAVRHEGQGLVRAINTRGEAAAKAVYMSRLDRDEQEPLGPARKAAKKIAGTIEGLIWRSASVINLQGPPGFLPAAR